MTMQFARSRRLVPLDALRVSCGVVGNGRLGNVAGVALASNGVAYGRRMVTVDHDVVEVHNLPGTHYTHSDVRKLKSHATAAHVRAACPNVTVDAVDQRVTLDDVEGFAARAREERWGVACLCLDDIPVACALAVALHGVCPVVQGVFGPGASFVEIAFSFPGVTRPTSETLALESREQQAGAGAFGIDTQALALVFARVAISVVAWPRTGRSLLALRPRESCLVVAGVRPEWVFGDWGRDVVSTAVFVKTP